MVVGAGLTGLWAAYALRRLAPRRSVTVLEAEHVGFGASGRNGGWLSHLVPGNRARYAAGPRGIDGAVRLQAAMVAGIDEVLATCARESIDADQHRGGHLVVATTPAGLHRLHQVRAADLRYGLAADQSELLDAGRTGRRIDVHGAVGGLLHPMVVRVDPAKLVTGLADAVERLGGVIHERTRVDEVGPGRVLTARGELAAGSVLVCTEGYGGPLLGRRSIIPINSSMIVTEPLPRVRLARASAGPGGSASATPRTPSSTPSAPPTTGSPSAGAAGRTGSAPGSRPAVRPTRAPSPSCSGGCARSSPGCRSRWRTPGPGCSA